MYSENKIKYINNIKEIEFYLNSKKITIIDFWANWCNPCKILSKRFENIANNPNNNNINFIKVNIDESQDLVKLYNIKTIPTLIYFNKYGEEIKKTFGLISETEIINNITEILKENKQIS